MLTTTILYFFIFTPCIIYSKPTLNDDSKELFFVSVIFRHGARTTESFYPNDPNNGQTFYPTGFGGLTNEGKLSEYNLGIYLRNLYDEFLGDTFIDGEFYSRSTDMTRTRMSAALVAAGLYPPNKIQQWSANLNWQPIPINYHKSENEDLFHPWAYCPYKSAAINNLPNEQEVQDKFILPYKDVYNYIQEQSGKNMQIPSDMQDIYLILKSEIDMNMTIPSWVNTVYPEPMNTIASTVYGYHNYYPEVKKINSGYLLQRIISDVDTKISGSSSRKINLFSGHESTVGYMLDALRLENNQIPPYSSAISFEFYKTGNEYFVKLRYRNSTDGVVPIDLQIPDCDEFCPLEQFKIIYRDLIPAIGITDACNQPFK